MKMKMIIMKMMMMMMMMMMMKQWKKKTFFRWNSWQIKFIWGPNRIVRKIEDLKDYLPYNDYDDKKLKFKIFKQKLADISNEIDEKLFETIFGHTLIKLADKLINTTNKEENQIIVKNIEKNKDKLLEKDDFGDWVIQAQQRSDLKYTINLILDFNEDQLDLVWASIEKI